MTINIMFVDDSSGDIESLYLMFRGDPYDIFAFSDPAEALDEIELTEFAAVVVDQNVGGDGMEFLRRVKKISPDTVGIIVHGQIAPEMARAALKGENVFEFVKKPWDGVKIRKVVEKAISHYEIKVGSRKLRVWNENRLFERRGDKRFKVKGGAIAAIRAVPEGSEQTEDPDTGAYIQMGPIMNISKSGLSFRYADMRSVSNERFTLDISFVRNRVYLKHLTNVAVEPVWVSPAAGEPAAADLKTTLRGVRFKGLAPDQMSDLDRFLQTYRIH